MNPIKDTQHLYHYTTQENAAKILDSEILKAKVPHGGEADMPKGVYLTELHPDNTTKVLVLNNFDDRARVVNHFTKFAAKTEVAFQFPKDKICGKYKATKRNTTAQRNEWLVEGDVDLNLHSAIFVHKDFVF